MSHPRLPIPTDWDAETWGCYLIEWPKSIEWEAILRGFVTTPLRGRFWDERTGSIKDVQAVGVEIDERNDVMSCQDIVNQLSIIATQITEVNVNVTQQVNVSQNLVNAVINQNKVIALANATASSFSVSTAMLSLQNYLHVDVRPLGGEDAPPPTEPEAEAAGITTTTQTSDRQCDVAYYLVDLFYRNVDALKKYYIPGAYDIPNAILTTLTAAMSAAALKFPEAAPWLIPASALSGLVVALQRLQQETLVEPALDAILLWIDNDFDDLVCFFWNSADNGDDTSIIQDGLVDLALAAAVPQPASLFLRAWFNFNHLATLFYEPLQYIVPNRPIGYECCPAPPE